MKFLILFLSLLITSPCVMPTLTHAQSTTVDGTDLTSKEIHRLGQAKLQIGQNIAKFTKQYTLSDLKFSVNNTDHSGTTIIVRDPDGKQVANLLVKPDLPDEKSVFVLDANAGGYFEISKYKAK